MSNKTPFKISPITIDIENAKTVKREILEIDPNRVKAGEAIVVKVSNWGGLKNQYFAVMNVDGKYMIVEQLGRKKEKHKIHIADIKFEQR